MDRNKIIESLKILIDTPPNISCEEYWKRVNEVAAKENKAFEEEKKKLTMKDEDLHRCFTI